MSNTGDRPAEGIQVRFRRPTAGQFNSFNLTDNPPGTTGGTDRMSYRFSTAGSASNADGLLILSGVLDPGRYATVQVKLTVASTFVPGSALGLSPSVVSGGCR